MKISNSFNPNTLGTANIGGKNAAQSAKNEKAEEKGENGLALALKPKFAHSREELIQNRIDDLREQLSALADADEIDDETKSKMRKSISEQLSELNVELMDVRKQRMEKEAEKAANSGDRSKKFDRYEPSEAMKNMNKAASADTALEQAKIQNSTANRLENRQSILKNEVKADAARGAVTKQKEQELVDIKSKIRNAGKTAGDKLNEADEKADEPTFMTFNTGLAYIEELRQRLREKENAALDESGSGSDTPKNVPPNNVSLSEIEKYASQIETRDDNVISNVKLHTMEEADKWSLSKLIRARKNEFSGMEITVTESKEN